VSWLHYTVSVIATFLTNNSGNLQIAGRRIEIPWRLRDQPLAATPWDPGTQVTISANLGEIFPVATDHLAPEGVDRWRLLGPDGEVHLDAALRKDGRVLTADVQLPAPGAYLAT
jgi:hypothetical protein